MLGTILVVDAVVLVIALAVHYGPRAPKLALPPPLTRPVAPVAPPVAAIVPRPGRVGPVAGFIACLGFLPILLGIVVAAQSAGEFAAAMILMSAACMAVGVAWIAIVVVIAKLAARQHRERV